LAEFRVSLLIEIFNTVLPLRDVVIENFIEIENRGAGLKNVQRAIVNGVFYVELASGEGAQRHGRLGFSRYRLLVWLRGRSLTAAAAGSPTEGISCT